MTDLQMDGIDSSRDALEAAMDAVNAADELENVIDTHINDSRGDSELVLIISLRNGSTIEVCTSEQTGGEKGDFELTWDVFDGEYDEYIIEDPVRGYFFSSTRRHCYPDDCSELVRFIALCD